MDMRPSARQQELIEVARTLAMGKFEPRAVEYDREARFPVVDYVDLRDAGFLGLGADLETYCLVVEEIAKGNAATALTFNMHCLTMLMIGEMADVHEMSDEKRVRHAELRARNFREVVEDGVYYG
jgi:alkylation response protein AidB-like acyl-CoA dehydrogenase